MGMYFSRRTGWRLAAVVPKPGGNRTGWAGKPRAQPAMEVFFGGKIIKLWGDGFPASHEADHQRLHKVCCFIPIYVIFFGPSETSFIPKLLLRVFCKTENMAKQNLTISGRHVDDSPFKSEAFRQRCPVVLFLRSQPSLLWWWSPVESGHEPWRAMRW